MNFQLLMCGTGQSKVMEKEMQRVGINLEV